jgi:hypothetical protein
MRTMAKRLGKQRSNCVVYLDDILIHSCGTIQKHCHLVEDIFSTLQSDNWWLAPNKCVWGVRAIQFVSYIVDCDRIHVEPGNVFGVTDWPTRICVRHIYQFLDLTGFYRRFVEHYATIAKLLNEAINMMFTGGTKQFNWTPELEIAFNTLTQASITAPILSSTE